MATKQRDTQRSKVYRAEGAAGMMSAGEGLSVGDCQALVEKWSKSAHLRGRYPRAALPVRVTDGRGKRRATYSARAHYPDEGIGPKIALPRWARSKLVLAHEYAHHLTHGQGASHGHEFIGCYLYLARVFLGRHVEAQLRDAFKAAKVRTRPPRKVTMTDAQRAERKARMEEINARRRLAVAAKPEPEAPGVRVRVELTDGRLIAEMGEGTDHPLPPPSTLVGTPTNITSMNFAGTLRRAILDAACIAEGLDPERPSEKAMRLSERASG